MDRAGVIQGRVMGTTEVDYIRQLLSENPHFSRYKISRVLCQLWNWRDPNGQLKDMAVAQTGRARLDQPARQVLCFPQSDAPQKGSSGRSCH